MSTPSKKKTGVGKTMPVFFFIRRAARFRLRRPEMD